MKDGYVPEEPHVEKAAQSEPGTPEIAMDAPTGARQRVRRPAPAHFHDRNTIALLHQSMRRHTAAETRTDDDKIEIELVVTLCHKDSLRTHCGSRPDPFIDHLPNQPQRFGTLRRIEPKHQENMVHILPGLQDDLRSLLLGAIREGLNTLIQNFDATSLYIDWGKAAQIGPYRRYQRMPSFSPVAKPVSPLLQHSLLNPANSPVADEIYFEVSWWRERNGQCRQRKLCVPRRQKRSQREITTGRIAGKNQAVGIGAVF